MSEKGYYSIGISFESLGWYILIESEGLGLNSVVGVIFIPNLLYPPIINIVTIVAKKRQAFTDIEKKDLCEWFADEVKKGSGSISKRLPWAKQKTIHHPTPPKVIYSRSIQLAVRSIHVFL